MKMYAGDEHGAVFSIIFNVVAMVWCFVVVGYHQEIVSDVSMVSLGMATAIWIAPLYAVVWIADR